MYATRPVGFCNSAQTMSRLMDIVFGCEVEPSVFYYQDDIIICTDSFKEHMRIMEIVANRLRAEELTFNNEPGKIQILLQGIKIPGIPVQH